MSYCFICQSVADGGEPAPMQVVAMSVALKLCTEHQRQARETIRAVVCATECHGCADHTDRCGHPDYCCAACPELTPEET